MKNWFLINLGDAMLVGEQQDRVKQLFLSAHTDADSPEEMAAFIRHKSEGRLHCEVIVYFSPLSEALARAFDAEPCEKPSPDGLSILAGSQDAWRVLFPEKTR